MLSKAFILLFIIFQNYAIAHPAWGIVVDSKGNIFFSDLMHNGNGTIWKLDRNGKLTSILENFHSHNLIIDSDDTLWAAENKNIYKYGIEEWEQRLVRISPDGKIDTLLETKNLNQFNASTFSMDESKNIYFFNDNTFYKRTIDGEPEIISTKSFGQVIGSYFDSENNLWWTDSKNKNGVLYKTIAGNKVYEYARNLIALNPENPPYREVRFHLLYGITTDENGFVYVAESADRRILKIGNNKKYSVIYTSESPWFPVGIYWSKGDLIIKESGFNGTHTGPRIIKIDKSNNRKILYEFKN